MVTFIAHLRVDPLNAPEFEALMSHVAAMTRENEPGVAYYGFAKSVDDRDTYMVVEVYKSAEAQAAHMATAWVRESLPVSARLIHGKPHIRQYISPGSDPVRHRIFPGTPDESCDAT